MQKLTHTLTGIDAASAKLLEEVQELFHSKISKVNPADDWRLEFYIMQVMCSDMCSAYQIERDKIMNIVLASHSYDRPKKEVDTAFRRLAHRGFIRGKTQNRVQFEPSRGKARYYELCLDRYDTEKVAA